ncbi:accessory gene regulator B family protein [Wukongibacter baidiensis]|uniref:accessory gene regulator ArgB-like protein n=1 Tax=Wukongibacter baidiensis TaxID=1723361 RepID=UPI003D7F9C0A
MSRIESLSNNIALKIAKILELDEDRQEIIAYGAFSLIQTIWSIGLVMAFGLLFKVFWEAVIISFAGALLRKYSGGAHATSPSRCAVIGVIISVGPALILDKISIYTSPIYIIIYALLTLAFTYYIIYRYSPVDTPNKPITKDETKKRLRKSAFKMIHFYFIVITILFICYSKEKSYIYLKFIVSICTGMLWQDMTLISLGHYIVSKLDAILGSEYS